MQFILLFRIIIFLKIVVLISVNCSKSEVTVPAKSLLEQVMENKSKNKRKLEEVEMYENIPKVQDISLWSGTDGIKSNTDDIVSLSEECKKSIKEVWKNAEGKGTIAREKALKDSEAIRKECKKKLEMIAGIPRSNQQFELGKGDFNQDIKENISKKPNITSLDDKNVLNNKVKNKKFIKSNKKLKTNDGNKIHVKTDNLNFEKENLRQIEEFLFSSNEHIYDKHPKDNVDNFEESLKTAIKNDVLKQNDVEKNEGGEE